MVKAVICGAQGKMGRVLNDIISKRNDIEIIGGIDINDTTPYADFEIFKSPSELKEKPQVIIDFSHPSALDGLCE